MSVPSIDGPAQRALELHTLVRDAIASGKNSVTLPPGDHRINGQWLPERQLWISNNDSGWKPVLFDLRDAHDFTLHGNGARLLIEGVLIPCVVETCRNLCVRDLTIDWVRPAFTEAVVTRHCQGGFEFETAPGADTFEVHSGRLVAAGQCAGDAT